MSLFVIPEKFGSRRKASSSWIPSARSASISRVAKRDFTTFAVRRRKRSSIQLGIERTGEMIERIGLVNFLEALGLEADAEFDLIRATWRGLAKANHPDIRPNDPEAATKFQQVQAAYEVLRAAEERRSWKPE